MEAIGKDQGQVSKAIDRLRIGLGGKEGKQAYSSIAVILVISVICLRKYDTYDRYDSLCIVGTTVLPRGEDGFYIEQAAKGTNAQCVIIDSAGNSESKRHQQKL